MNDNVEDEEQPTIVLPSAVTASAESLPGPKEEAVPEISELQIGFKIPDIKGTKASEGSGLSLGNYFEVIKIYCFVALVVVHFRSTGNAPILKQVNAWIAKECIV